MMGGYLRKSQVSWDKSALEEACEKRITEKRITCCIIVEWGGRGGEWKVTMEVHRGYSQIGST